MKNSESSTFNADDVPVDVTTVESREADFEDSNAMVTDAELAREQVRLSCYPTDDVTNSSEGDVLFSCQYAQTS